MKRVSLQQNEQFCCASILAAAYRDGNGYDGDPTRLTGFVSLEALQIVNGLLAAGTAAMTGMPLVAASGPVMNRLLAGASDRYAMKNILTNLRRAPVREFFKQLRQVIRAQK